MLDWKISGVKVGTYCDASVLNDLPDLEDMQTFAGKTVRRLDDDLRLWASQLITALWYSHLALYWCSLETNCLAKMRFVVN